MNETGQDREWAGNYFNYFTEIEEHFQRVRGSGLFLLSSLDWALIESWKNAGVPLEAVLRGIDAAFEKWRSRKTKVQMVNSLAYCAQAVLTEAQTMAGTSAPRGKAEPSAPFAEEELKSYLLRNAGELTARPEAAYQEIGAALERLAAEAEVHYRDLEDLERRLTSLEDKMMAAARMLQTEEQLLAGRRELDFQLKPYRGKMTAEQISMLEKQFLERRLLEASRLPRLSLFYMR